MNLGRGLLLLLLSFSLSPASARYVVEAETAYLSSDRYTAQQGAVRLTNKQEKNGYTFSLFGHDREYDGGSGFREGGYGLGGYHVFKGGYLTWDATHSPGAVTYAKVKGSVEPRMIVNGGGEIGLGIIAAEYDKLSTFALHPVTTWSLPGGWRVDAGGFAVFTDEFVSSGHASLRYDVNERFSVNAFFAAGRVIEDATVIADFHQKGLGISTSIGRSRLDLGASLYDSSFRKETVGTLRWEFPL